ncbi:MAG: hypothetical protein WBF36_08050 [Desulfobulbales bacterium]
MKKLVTSVLLVMMLACFSASAMAGEQAEEGNWDFNLAPLYVWMVNMDGNMVAKGKDTPVNVDFGTLFDNLEAIFTAHFEAWRENKIGLVFDYSYTELGTSGAAGPISLKIDFASTLVEGLAMYRFANNQHNFDILGGVRYSKLEPDITLIVPPLGTFSKTQDWVDPIVGVRYIYDFGNKWKFSARGDLGGFGVGCDFTWNVSALVHFQPWKNVAIVGGYRVLDQDYETGSGDDKFIYDMRYAGPVVGLNIVW